MSEPLGMGSLGPVAFQADEEQPFLGYELAQGRDYSEATAARIDQDVQRLLEERHEVVCRLLTDQREKLDRLVETLLQEKRLTRIRWSGSSDPVLEIMLGR